MAQRQPFNIIDSSFLPIFEMLPSEQQREAVDALKTWREKITNGTIEERRNMGLSAVGSGDQVELNRQIDVALDTTNWQLCQFHRYSKPSRIAEAEPYIRAVIAHYEAEHKDATKDATPMLYLAVAPHKVPGKEDEVYKLLKDGLTSESDSRPNPNTFLWAQAAVSRMLRRVGRVDEAKKVEKNVVNWTLSHPFGMPPSKLHEITDDDADPEAINFIFEHPEVKKLYAHTFEFPNGMGGFPGMVMMNF